MEGGEEKNNPLTRGRLRMRRKKKRGGKKTGAPFPATVERGKQEELHRSTRKKREKTYSLFL